MSVVVVGAGISGLTAAWRLRQSGADVLVLEGANRPGGVLLRGPIASVVTDAERGAVAGHGQAGEPGRVVDLGAESLLARRPEAVALAREVGLGDDLQPPATTTAAIYSRGRLHPMPKGHLMGVPAQAESVAGLLAPEEIDRLATSLAAAGPPVTTDTSIGQWLSGRLGPAIVERLVEPLLGGVYAGRVGQLSVRAALAALAPALADGRPLGPEVQALTARATAAGPVFTGIAGGVARLAEATERAFVQAGGRVRYDTRVTALAPGAAGWRVGVGPEGRQSWLDAERVLLALPAPATARLLAQLPQTAAAATELAGVELASMALVAATLPPGTFEAAGPGLSGVLVPEAERRLVKAMTFTSAKWGWASGGPELIRLSVGRAGEADALHRSDDDLTAAVLADASEILGHDLRPAAARVQRWGGGLPQYDVGHLDRIARAQAVLAEVPGLECCGSVWGGVGVPACIATASAAAARLGSQEIGR